MHIRKIQVKNLMHFKEAEVDFPTVGITLVTGDNGSGKSGCFIEAPATAFWGKTFRQAPVWKDDKPGYIRVITDDVDIEKIKKPNSSPSTTWNTSEHAQQYPTTTKATRELEDIVGNWDTHRRTAILSTQEQEASYFTLATDAERKKLIEGLLDVDIFDPALKACRKDRDDIKSKLSVLVNKCDILKERVTNLTDSLGNAENQLGDPPNDDIEEMRAKQKTLKERHAKLIKYIKIYRDEVQSKRTTITNINSELAEATAEVISAKKEADRLSIDLCPFCGEKISQAKKESAKDEYEKRKKLSHKMKENKAREIEELQQEIKELEEERDELENSKNAANTAYELQEQEIKNRERELRDYENRKVSLNRLKEDLDKAADEYKSKRVEKKKIKGELNEVLAAETVLGLEGVRAQIIGKALGGIEAVANRWLAQIADPDLRIELKPYSETKTAGVKDKIGLIIHGAGGGHGYKGASAGERRRIDVALLFALAEIAAAARGVSQGDIFVDEIADSLDLRGRTSVAEALKELAKDRSVVVITHDEEFAKMLDPVKHIVVTKKDGISTIN